MTFWNTVEDRISTSPRIILSAVSVSSLLPITPMMDEVQLSRLPKAIKRRPSLLAHPVIKEITEHYADATPAQVLLNWGLQRGYSVIPKSITPGKFQ